ncbi:hypothetical protein D3C73_839250 [compost metagenome]
MFSVFFPIDAARTMAWIGPLNRVAIMPRGKHGQTLGQGDRVRFSRHAMRGAGIEEKENVYCLEQTWRA